MISCLDACMVQCILQSPPSDHSIVLRLHPCRGVTQLDILGVPKQSSSLRNLLHSHEVIYISNFIQSSTELNPCQNSAYPLYIRCPGQSRRCTVNPPFALHPSSRASCVSSVHPGSTIEEGGKDSSTHIGHLGVKFK